MLENERTQLNSYRYAFTVLSSIVVYAIAFALLKSSKSNELGWEDRSTFSHLAMIVVGIGSVFSLMFHATVPEKRGDEEEREGDNEEEPLVPAALPPQQDIKRWQEWFHQPNFYMTAIIYMVSRLIVNMSQVYMPFYLTDVLQEEYDPLSAPFRKCNFIFAE